MRLPLDVPTVFAAVVGFATVVSGCDSQVESAPGEVPLFDDLGDHAYGVSATPEAQRYFDQGMRLYYAFNHAEAIRSFRQAQALDPECAMCWWGEAMAYGPNINLAMDSASEVAAHAAVQEALAKRTHASEKEAALIGALATRYEAVPSADNRAALDSAYAGAMGELASAYPNDQEIAVLDAESQMDLRPWDYWGRGGQLVPSMAAAVGRLERVIARDSTHPGACHFYIHAVEEVQPERAVPCAERLADLMPGAGHLVHMPGHVYIRVGRFADAVRANEHAVHADETYIQDVHPTPGFYTAGYYPHNYDFMAFAASMAGGEEQAVAAADHLARLIPEEMLGAPGMGFLEHWRTRRLQMDIRFARWEDILAVEAPPESQLHARAMWDYARGRALVGTGDLDGAAQALARLEDHRTHPSLGDISLEFNPSPAILAIAAKVLEAEIAAGRGDVDEAIAAFEEAAALEDGLTYGEPPEWSIPVREEYGAALIRLELPAKAEPVFRADLERFPGNGWSLYGLATALRDLGQNVESAEVRSAFSESWVGDSDAPPPGF